MWLEYFQTGHIFGVDILKEFPTTDPRCTIIQADQGNVAQMTKIAEQHGRLDIVIDDGCHYGAQIKVSFECLWPAVKTRGFYIIEDCFALWHPAFASAVDGPAFLKTFVDDVNWRGKSFYGQPNPPPVPPPLTVLESTIDSVTYRRGLTILRKK
jgi:hypothetical protein